MFDLFGLYSGMQNQMASAEWWFLLSDEQKVNYLKDSSLTSSQIKQLLKYYGEETLTEKEDN